MQVAVNFVSQAAEGCSSTVYANCRAIVTADLAEEIARAALAENALLLPGIDRLPAETYQKIEKYAESGGIHALDVSNLPVPCLGAGEELLAAYLAEDGQTASRRMLGLDQLSNPTNPGFSCSAGRSRWQGRRVARCHAGSHTMGLPTLGKRLNS